MWGRGLPDKAGKGATKGNKDTQSIATLQKKWEKKAEKAVREQTELLQKQRRHRENFGDEVDMYSVD